MTPVRIFVFAAWCATVAAATPAHADVANRAAQRYFEQGEALFKVGKFTAALREYQKAFDAEPLPELLYNIGQCYRNLGDYEHAILNFKTYLSLLPNAPDRAQVETLIENLEDRVARGEGAGMTLNRTPAPPEHEPIYRKWWFWTGVAVVAVAAGGVVLYETSKGGPPDTNLGNIAFGK